MKAFRSLRTLSLALGVLMLSHGWALAYVGPGAGITMLGALWGVVIAIVMALGILITWPLRRFVKARRTARERAARYAETGKVETSTSA